MPAMLRWYRTAHKQAYAQDGVELAAALRDAVQSAAAPLAEVPGPKLEEALRDFERRRSTRCAPLVAQARQNGRRLLAERSWLVRSTFSTSLNSRARNSEDQVRWSRIAPAVILQTCPIPSFAL